MTPKRNLQEAMRDQELMDQLAESKRLVEELHAKTEKAREKAELLQEAAEQARQMYAECVRDRDAKLVKLYNARCAIWLAKKECADNAVKA